MRLMTARSSGWASAPASFGDAPMLPRESHGVGEAPGTRTGTAGFPAREVPALHAARGGHEAPVVHVLREALELRAAPGFRLIHEARNALSEPSVGAHRDAGTLRCLALPGRR